MVVLLVCYLLIWKIPKVYNIKKEIIFIIFMKEIYLVILFLAIHHSIPTDIIVSTNVLIRSLFYLSY